MWPNSVALNHFTFAKANGNCLGLQMKQCMSKPNCGLKNKHPVSSAFICSQKFHLVLRPYLQVRVASNEIVEVNLQSI